MKDLREMNKKEVAWWLAEQVVQLTASVGVFYGVRALFDRINPKPKAE